ncbi:MAG: hypothetical protein M3O30_08430 [Planctomycetota bacterium]|nr:hypothetical protein [Planctomycetota bacterium]
MESKASTFTTEPPRPRTSADTNPDGRKSASDAPTEEVFSEISTRLSELRAYSRYYLQAHIDLIKIALRKGVVFLALAVVATVASAGLIVTAVVLICDGIADGLATLFRSRWLGELVTGVLVIAVLVAAIWFVVNKIFGLSHAKTMARFEAMRNEQRADFGHDVKNRAAIGPRPKIKI